MYTRLVNPVLYNLFACIFQFHATLFLICIRSLSDIHGSAPLDFIYFLAHTYNVTAFYIFHTWAGSRLLPDSARADASFVCFFRQAS